MRVDLKLYGVDLKIYNPVLDIVERASPGFYAVDGDTSMLFGVVGTLDVGNMRFIKPDGKIFKVVKLGNLEEKTGTDISGFLGEWHYGHVFKRWAEQVLFPLWEPETESDVVNQFIVELKSAKDTFAPADIIVPSEKLLAFLEEYLLNVFGLPSETEVHRAEDALRQSSDSFSILGDQFLIIREVKCEES